MKRKLPKVKTDRQAAALVESADLSQYDLSVMKPMRFEFAPKEARVNMRIPTKLLAAVKSAAQHAGVPYQRFIRHALEVAITTRK
jgi:predicted DNA binding CopG/RHH family protein